VEYLEGKAAFQLLIFSIGLIFFHSVIHNILLVCVRAQAGRTGDAGGRSDPEDGYCGADLLPVEEVRRRIEVSMQVVATLTRQNFSPSLISYSNGPSQNANTSIKLGIIY